MYNLNRDRACRTSHSARPPGVARKIYSDLCCKREQENGTLSRIIWECDTRKVVAVGAMDKVVVVGAEERASSQESNLSVARTWYLGCQRLSNPGKKRGTRGFFAGTRRVGRRLGRYVIGLSPRPSPHPLASISHLWGQRLHRRRWHTRSVRSERLRWVVLHARL